MQISVVIIVKNESDNLKLSLPKLSWCQDVIVVDDHSEDDSVEIAKSYNAEVFLRPFDGFGSQKQFAVSKAKNNWILNIDADEVLTDELIEELQSIDEKLDISAYTVPIRHVFMGKAFKYGKESAFPHLRLFNKEKGNFNDASVHEKVKVTGEIKHLKHVILHYSYKNLEHYFQKFNAYTSMGAKRLKEKGKTRSLVFCILGFPIYFFKHYFIYGNVLNGRPGFIWAYLNAWYHTIKYFKLNELNHQK